MPTTQRHFLRERLGVRHEVVDGQHDDGGDLGPGLQLPIVENHVPSSLSAARMSARSVTSEQRSPSHAVTIWNANDSGTPKDWIAVVIYLLCLPVNTCNGHRSFSTVRIVPNGVIQNGSVCVASQCKKTCRAVMPPPAS